MKSGENSAKCNPTIAETPLLSLLITDAIFELSKQKGILTGAEVNVRIAELKSET